MKMFNKKNFSCSELVMDRNWYHKPHSIVYHKSHSIVNPYPMQFFKRNHTVMYSTVSLMILCVNEGKTIFIILFNVACNCLKLKKKII